MKNQIKYFFVAVFFIGSIGIWLPIIVEALVDKKVTLHNIPPNITTYFESILFAGCIDYFLIKLRQLDNSGVASVFFNLILLALLGVALVAGAVISNIYRSELLAIFLSVIGVIVAYRIWWLANVNNPNFYPNPQSSLGDDPEKPLSNGK